MTLRPYMVEVNAYDHHSVAKIEATSPAEAEAIAMTRYGISIKATPATDPDEQLAKALAEAAA